MPPHSQVSADGKSGSMSAVGTCGGNANQIPGASDSSKNDSASPSTTTSEPSSTATHHPLMRLSEVLLASLSVLPGRNVALPTSDTYSQPLSTSFIELGRDGCLWNRSQLSLVTMKEEHLADTLVAWSRSGMICSGTPYPLAPLVRITRGTGSGLWATPRHEGFDAGAHNGKPDSLHSQVKMWPTPAARDYRTPNSKPYTERGGGKKGEQLPNAVKFWPTPTAMNETGGLAMCKWGGAGARKKLKTMISKSELNGALNPTWVEWLMGFPLGHTALKDSATQSSRKSPTSSGKQSTKSKQQQQQHDNENETTTDPDPTKGRV